MDWLRLCAVPTWCRAQMEVGELGVGHRSFTLYLATHLQGRPGQVTEALGYPLCTSSCCDESHEVASTSHPEPEVYYSLIDMTSQHSGC